MAGPKPQDVYQGYNASPSGIADTDSPAGRGPRFSVQANPSDFGANVGQALEQAGKTGEQLGDEASDIAIRQQGMINETMSTNAETQYMSQLAALSGRYKQKEGLDAVHGLSDYSTAVTNLRQQIRDNLPEGPVQRAFDTLSQRHEAYALSDANTYASTQIKQADIKSANALADLSVQKSGDIHVASDDARFAENMGDVKFSTVRMMQTQGWGSAMNQDPKTGSVTFPDSPEGQQAKAIYQNEIDKRIGQAQELRYQTLADQNVMSAYQKYQQNKDSVPGDTQVKLDAYFKPKIRDAAADQYMNTALSQVAQDHKDAITSSSSGANPNNLGNVKTAAGAANNTAEFANPATPVDGAILAANTLRSGYQGLTLQQIGEKWAPSSENKTSDWVNNVSKASGIAANSVPNLNDPAQLSSVLKGIATAEKSQKDRALFSDDVISQGVQASIGGKQPNTSVPTVPSGEMTSGYQTQADYMATHKDELVNNAMQWARDNYPNDPTMEQTMRQRMDNTISAAIQTQTANYKQDNQTVMRALAGDFTKGTPPQTMAELRNIPGVSQVMDRVAIQDDKFYGSIEGKIAEFSKKNTVTNSANGYDTLMRTTAPIDDVNGRDPNGIYSQDHLDKLLGRSDGTGINMKDYNDAKPLIESSQAWKDYVHQNLKTIANANGNVDGLGQQRAMQWYSQVSQMHDKALSGNNDPMAETKFIKGLQDVAHPPAPSLMEQISNFARKLWNGNSNQQSQNIPTLTNKAQFDALPSGSLYMRNGQQYRKP